MANDPHIRTTGSTPNDPVRRDPALSDPSYTDPAYRNRDRNSSSGWLKWAAIAAALVLGLLLLTSLFDGPDGEQVAAVNEPVVVETAPTAPAATDDATVVVQPSDDATVVTTDPAAPADDAVVVQPEN